MFESERKTQANLKRLKGNGAFSIDNFVGGND